MFGFTNRYTNDLVEVITNPFDLYEGNLIYYAHMLFEAPNMYHGYHGLRHMLHVTWVCYKACEYYGRLGQLSRRSMRNLLIVGMFHDYGHSGRSGNDAHNINIAVSSMRAALAPEDISYADDIESIIRATQYPHLDLGHSETLEQSIIRDADMSQAFGTTWIGDVLAGLGSELDKTPVEMLEQQLIFLTGVKFSSDFGNVFYGQEAIDAKIREGKALLEILRS